MRLLLKTRSGGLNCDRKEVDLRQFDQTIIFLKPANE
jgi:hypothetical protein